MVSGLEVLNRTVVIAFGRSRVSALNQSGHVLGIDLQSMVQTRFCTNLVSQRTFGYPQQDPGRYRRLLFETCPSGKVDRFPGISSTEPDFGERSQCRTVLRLQFESLLQNCFSFPVVLVSRQ